MKFSVNKAAFEKAILPVTTVATTSVKDEYADAFKFTLTADKGGLVASANNGWVAITNQVDAYPDIDYGFDTAGSVNLKVEDFTRLMTAFKADEKLTLSIDNNSLVVQGASEDAEELMSMPTEATTIVMPSTPADFQQDMEISRQKLSDALTKILFAVGFEKYKRHFLYWKLHVAKQNSKEESARFVAGDGGRFVTYTIKGAGLASAGKTAGKDEVTMCFYSQQTKDLFPKLLSMFAVDDVQIKSHNSGNADEDVPDQIVITIGTATLSLVGHDSDVKWPDENLFLNRKNTNYRFTVPLKDWELAINGVLATNTRENQKATTVHVGEINFDFKTKAVTVKANTLMKAVKKVKMGDTWVNSGEPDQVSFRCSSEFLKEFYKYGDKNEFVQIELVDSKQPFMVRYFAAKDIDTNVPLKKVNITTNVEESYTMFFASTAK